MFGHHRPVYGCKTYADWLSETLRSGDLEEWRRGRVV